MKPGEEGPRGDRVLHDRLGRLVSKHWEELVYFAGTFTPWRSRETAEGIVQDGLVLVLERRISLPEDDDDALAIVMGVIRNVGRNRRRRDSALVWLPEREQVAAAWYPFGGIGHYRVGGVIRAPDRSG